MKKRWLAILIAIATCLAVLSGCSFVKVFEKDVQVVLRNGEEYVGTYTVNIFNNAVVCRIYGDPQERSRDRVVQ